MSARPARRARAQASSASSVASASAGFRGRDLHGPLELAPTPEVRVLPVGTAAELAQACEQEFEACDGLLMAAAVADFRPSRPAATKLKKDDDATLTIELEPTTDGSAASRSVAPTARSSSLTLSAGLLVVEDARGETFEVVAAHGGEGRPLESAIRDLKPDRVASAAARLPA
jgi:phosphopantothenoylcysteine synthetase/decarboxylase